MGLDMFLRKKVDGLETAAEYAAADSVLDYLQEKEKALVDPGVETPNLERFVKSPAYVTDEFVEKAQLLKSQYILRGFFNTIWEEIGYWRKDNHIHRWFVDVVQDGEDDCGHYEVSKDQLLELLKICQKLVKYKPKRTVVPHFHRQGNKAGFRRRLDVPFFGRSFYKESKIDKKKVELISSLLPTQSGFFFGSADYDFYYFMSLEETIKIIENVLENTNFEKEMVVYHSSW